MSSGHTRAMSVVVLALVASFAAGDINEGETYIGSGHTAAKTQAKLWFNDGTWWGILLDGSDQYIHRFQGDTAVALDDGFVDTPNSAQFDVLWTGEYLFAFMGHGSTPRLYKFLYDPLLRNYVLVPGFPVDFSMGGGSADATIAVDSTDQAWIAYRDGTDIRVIWSTSSDHLTWNETGTVIESGVYSLDVAAIVAFDSKIGVMWSDQSDDNYAFRYHEDNQPDTQWSSTEIVSTISGIAEDHVNLAVTPGNEILAATKNKTDDVHLWRRSAAGVWSGPYDVGSPGTRPNVVYDSANGDVYVLYTDLSNGSSATIRPILFKRAPLSDLSQLASASADVFLSGDSYNDVTTTKQVLTTEMGLLAAAKRDGFAGFRRIAFGTPLVDVAASAYEGFAPMPVDFSGAGLADDDDTIVSYAWTLGDGSSSTAANPSHTYASPGLYEARLTVTDGSGRTASRSVHVSVLDPGSLLAQVNFQPPTSVVPTGYSEDNGDVFDATRGYGWSTSLSSKDYAGETGDGRLDTYVYISNSGTATWNYALPNGDYRITVVAGSPRWSGRHYVTLEGETVLAGANTSRGEFAEVIGYPVTVSDGDLTLRIGSGSDSKKTKLCYVIIRQQGEPVPQPLAVQASATPTQGIVPLATSFTASASGGSGTIVSWDWDFDDGTTDTVQNPSHTYTAIGTYVATVTATDDAGATASTTVTVTVNDIPAPPTASITASPSSGVAPLSVSFTGAGTSNGGTIVGYDWDFGDGGSSALQNPSHTFAEGTHTVTLTVTDNFGQTGQTTTTITANAAPSPGDVVAQINFQPSGFATPAGYTADTAAPYSDATGFGWTTSVSTRSYDEFADDRLDSYAFVSNTSTGTWEYALANGDYVIDLVAGSPRWSGLHFVDVEGATAIDGVSTARGEFVETTGLAVTVSDGKLTVTIGGSGTSKKTKLCYLIIRRAG